MGRGVIEEDLPYLIDKGILRFKNLHPGFLGRALDDLPEVLETLGADEVMGLEDDLAFRIIDVVARCPVPCDYAPKRSYPLFRAREVLEYLALGGAGGSPEGDQRLPPGPAPRRG